MANTKPQTISDVARLGGEATSRKYDKEHFAKIGSKGGESNKQKHGPDYFKELSRKGVEARARKKKLKEEKALNTNKNS